MTDDTDERLEELRNQESRGNRLDRDDPQSKPDFAGTIESALDAVENGDQQDTITAYDPKLAALLHALDEDQQMDDVFEQLKTAYDGDSGVDQVSRSAIIRLAIRVGLQEGTETTLEDLGRAIERRQTTTV